VRAVARHGSPGLLSLASLAWLAGCVALVAAAGDLARGIWYTPELLAAAHLIGLGFLTTAIAGALLHLAPNMSVRRPPGGPLPGLLIWAGALVLAGGLWRDLPAAEAAGGTLLAVGIGWLLAGVVAIWRGRRGSWPEPLAGLVVASAWLAAVLVLGLLMIAERRWGFLGLDRTRLIGAHATMATLGWVGGLILAMTTRMAPMMLIAPARRLGVARAALGVWHCGVAALTGAVVTGTRALALAGAAALALAVAGFVVYLADAARRRRRRPPAAVQHLLAGLAALLAAATLVLVLPAARAAPVALVLALVGFAAGVTAGHILIMVPTMCWVARFGGLRRGGGRPPPVAHLAPPLLGWCEGLAFAAGTGLLAAGVLAGSEPLALAGAASLTASAAGVVAAVALAALRPWTPAAGARAPLPMREDGSLPLSIDR
jgi:hypothetical protein